MTISYFILKAKRRFWRVVVNSTRKTYIYPFIYSSFWHYLLYPKKSIIDSACYYSAVPNPGAGIGHQMANWIAGYWFAGTMGLKFAHIPFSSEKWENFLGFGEHEISTIELIKTQGYKKVRLPLFDEVNRKEIDLIKKIIASYQDEKIVFIAEQDQFYRDQIGVMEHIKRKFHTSSARQNDHLVYSKENFNIAIHVRRGDIVMGKETNANYQMRWQDNDYFEKVLTTLINQLKTEKPIAVYLFSQGDLDDFENFGKFKNIHFCLNMSAQDSFLHMVYADLLITSKSSFSYKPALLSNGIKVCPKDFWHGYPTTNDWILVNEDASFDINQLMNSIIN